MRHLTFLLVGALFATAVLADEQTTRGNQLEDNPPVNTHAILEGTRAVMELSDPAWTPRRYRALFDSVAPNEIASLQTHRHDSIAVRAAWQAVLMNCPEKKLTYVGRPGRHSLEWFLGFLEGRLRVRAPSWWADALLDSRAQGDLIYPDSLPKLAYYPTGIDELRAPVGTTLRRKGKVIRMTVGEESARIPASLLGEVRASSMHDTIAASMTESHCYVAVHESVGYSYLLACVDRSSGKTRWQSEVRGAWAGFSNGYHEMRVQITEQGDRTVVFGWTLTWMYIEVFQLADGTPISRFASSY